MAARIIVFIPLVLAETLSLFLFFNAPSESPASLLYPMAGGYYPWAISSGEPGYSPEAWEMWRLAELAVYAGLGVPAFIRRSLPLALANAFLWIGSLAIGIYRFCMVMNGIH